MHSSSRKILLFAVSALASCLPNAQQNLYIMNPKEGSPVDRLDLQVVTPEGPKKAMAEAKTYIVTNSDNRRSTDKYFVALVLPIAHRAYLGGLHESYVETADGIVGITAYASEFCYSKGSKRVKDRTVMSLDEVWKIVATVVPNELIGDGQVVPFSDSIVAALRGEGAGLFPKMLFKNVATNGNQLTVTCVNPSTNRSATLVLDTAGKKWALTRAQVEGKDLDLKKEGY